MSKVLEIAVQMGGTITGEHGIGTTKKAYMNLIFSKKDMAILQGIKQAVDPNGICNPGKIV